MRWWMAVVATAMLTIAPGAAFAARSPDPTAVAQALGDKAREAYARGAFEEAIALYLDAYETAPSAGFLYNIAFVYQKKLDAPELAAQYYERVAKAKDADADLRTKATEKATAIRAELATRAPDPKDPPPDPKDPKRPIGVKTPRVLDPPVITIPKDPEPAGGSAVPWIIMGSGVALLGTGVAFGVIASGTETDFQAATDPGQRRSLQSQGQGEAILADVLMIAGIAGVGIGIVLLAGEDDNTRNSGVHVSVTPVVLEGGAGLTFGGRL